MKRNLLESEMCSKIRESRNIKIHIPRRLYENIGASRLIEIHRKFIEIRRTRYNYVRRGHYSSHVAVLSAIHRDSFARFAMLMTTGWHLAGIWKYAKACVPPIDEYVDHLLGTVIFNSISSNGEKRTTVRNTPTNRLSYADSTNVSSTLAGSVDTIERLNLRLVRGV